MIGDWLNHVHFGDCRDSIRAMISAGVRVNLIVTSPPYWGLRDYGHPGQLGLESTPEQYTQNMVEVFRLARELLTDDGTLWLNLGDCYATGAGRVGACPGGGEQGAKWRGDVDRIRDEKRGYRGNRNGHEGKHGYGDGGAGVGPMTQPNRMPIAGLKPKDLVGIPWRVAFALQADGWYLRSRLPWLKRNPMPESVTDRPATSVEEVFLLSKSERYFYDGFAVKKPQSENERTRRISEQERGLDSVYNLRREQPHGQPAPGQTGCAKSVKKRQELAQLGVRNWRNGDPFFDTWQGMLTDDDGEPLALIVNPRPYKGAHFATFPPQLIEPMILAGTSAHGHCSKCGAGWRRVVEKGAPDIDHQQACGGDATGGYQGEATKDYAGAGAQNASETKARILAGMREKTTIGWQPACKCGADIVHGIVFDPFGGSGTTGEVAQNFGRDWILCELNRAYGPLQQDRTRQMGMMLG